MQIVCYNCKNIWVLPEKELPSAGRKAIPGSEIHTYICPKCGAGNVVTDEDLIITERTQSPIPVTGAASMEEALERRSSITDSTANAAPTNPVEPPISGIWKRGIVRVRGLEARRDHSIWSEVVGGFNKGETVPVLDTWTDGASTWVQLGPERWVNMDKDGKVTIELIDD